MNAQKHRLGFIFLLIIIIIWLGCIQAPDDTSNSSTSSTSATNTCGKYASRTTDKDFHVNVCSWNKIDKQLTCSGSNMTTANVISYSSESDFISEINGLAVMKRTKLINIQNGAASYTTNYTITYSYNTSNQLKSRIIDTISDDTYSETYTSWDSSNRPNLGTRSYDLGGGFTECTDASLIIAYDDSNKKITRTITGGTENAAGDCKSIVIEDTYDADYNLTKNVTTIAAATTLTYTIDTATEVCE